MRAAFSILILVATAMAQFPPLSPYHQFLYYGFESRLEGNGHVVTYGPTYKTSIALDASRMHGGDSSVVGSIYGANGSTNCSIAADSCQRHRSYLIQRFRGKHVSREADTSLTTGVRLAGPIWTDFWYRTTVPLRGAPYYDWESPATWVDDSTDANLIPVTIGRDSAGYIHWEHVPEFDSSVTDYQLTQANDPNPSKNQIKLGEWVHIQTYMDMDSTSGYGVAWVDGVVHSRARIRGRISSLAQFHAGLYASPAVATGSVWNDDLFLQHVPDTNYAIHYLLDRGDQ